jgi:hypothetical protein
VVASKCSGIPHPYSRDYLHVSFGVQRTTGRPRNSWTEVERLENPHFLAAVVALVAVSNVDHRAMYFVAVPDKRCDIPTDLLMYSTTPKEGVQEDWT